MQDGPQIWPSLESSVSSSGTHSHLPPSAAIERIKRLGFKLTYIYIIFALTYILIGCILYSQGKKTQNKLGPTGTLSRKSTKLQYNILKLLDLKPLCEGFENFQLWCPQVVVSKNTH